MSGPGVEDHMLEQEMPLVPYRLGNCKRFRSAGREPGRKTKVCVCYCLTALHPP